MKSSEFITEASIFDERTLKNKAWKSPPETIRWLKQNGFKEIGDGNFAVTYAKPGHNRVVKVSTQADVCWIRFAQYAMSVTDNKHLPKIPWIRRYQGNREGIAQEFFITIIERLLPITSDNITSIKDPAILLGLFHYGDFAPFMRNRILDALHVIGYAKDEWLDGDEKIVAAKFGDHPFIQALEMINSTKGRCWTDLHEENLMVRSDGTIVITDPIAGNY